MLVAILDACSEDVVMADFIGQVLPVSFFVFPVSTEQTSGKYRGVFELAPVFLHFDKLVDLLDKHVIRGDVLWVFENTEQNALWPTVMIRECLECRTQAFFKFFTSCKDVGIDGFVRENVGTFATVA